MATMSRTARALANGQSRTCRIWFSISVPIMSKRGPPRRSGVTKAPSAGTNTSVHPTAIPTAVCGITTRRNTAQGPAPRSRAASTSDQSIRSSAT